MWIFNNILNMVFDGLLFPFRTLHPLVGLTVVSVLGSIGMLMAYKKTSNQDGIEAVKRQIHACIYEIRLFSDDFRAIMVAQFRILGHNLKYLGLSLVPVVWMIIPFVLVVAQMQFHYGYSGLEPGETAIVKVVLKDGANVTDDSGGAGGFSSAGPGDALSLEAPDGLILDSPQLWIPELNEVDWRIEAVESGNFELVVRAGSDSYTKTVRVSDDVVRRSPIRHSGGFLDSVLYPAEKPLPSDAPIESISIIYPEPGIDVFGWEINWLILFIVLLIVIAFALRKPFGVQL
jgi:hypothetical protein